MQENEKKEGHRREEIFSRAVRAGKRTYFFDVKTTRKNDHYLIITESKKRWDNDGKFFFEKHKLFLYKEDFDKFTDALTETLAFINKANEAVELENQSEEYPADEADKSEDDPES